ncbi:hypothetical protein M8818_005946 [Zalaria obscura]|uniref:Uncharacterized protein n=1 Tax=Zalaria obscura TaxID=2024903 RepID=A0ACC3S776_9PEZI
MLNPDVAWDLAMALPQGTPLAITAGAGGAPIPDRCFGVRVVDLGLNRYPEWDADWTELGIDLPALFGEE